MRQLSCVLCAGVVALLAAASPLSTDAVAATSTVVSLSFDDDRQTQTAVPTMLAAHGMHATFYVNSGTVGTGGKLTWDQLTNIAAGGNEIAGHTIDHVDLLSVSATEAKRQICEDRGRLMDKGFAVTDFAYPYGNGFDNSTIRNDVQQCGYNSGRMVWGLRDAGCSTCPAGESIPPSDRWAVRTKSSIVQTDTLSYIESLVTNAEQNGGGWVTLVFHDVCSGCNQYAVTQSDLQGFLDWLQPRTSRGTVVKTVAQVIGGAVQPAPPSDSAPPVSTISCNGGSCSSGWYGAAVHVSLSATDNWSGVAAIRYTTDGSDPTASSTVYSGPFDAATTTRLKFRAWDNAGNVEPTNSQPIQIDGEPPTVAISFPAPGASISGNVKLQATASDAASGVAKVTFFVDGQSVGSSSGSPFQVNWNTRKVSKGPHTLTAVALDRVGNQTTSAPVGVTVT